LGKGVGRKERGTSANNKGRKTMKGGRTNVGKEGTYLLTRKKPTGMKCKEKER